MGQIVEQKALGHYKNKCGDIINKLQSDSSRLAVDLSKIDKIFNFYEKYRQIIHKNMDHKDIQTKTDDLMDNHKIAAAFFCSFLKARPLSYIPGKSSVPPNNLELRANEHGAFLFGLQVVQDFWADKFTASVSVNDREIYQKPIQLPKTDTDSYIHWFNKLFINGIEHYLDYENNKFDEKFIFTVAHIYFLLDSFSYQFHKAELHEKNSEYWRLEYNKLMEVSTQKAGN